MCSFENTLEYSENQEKKWMDMKKQLVELEQQRVEREHFHDKQRERYSKYVHLLVHHVGIYICIYVLPKSSIGRTLQSESLVVTKSSGLLNTVDNGLCICHDYYFSFAVTEGNSEDR